MHATALLLLIDDDKALLNGLAETIKRESDYRVLTANNGNLGIQLARENLPQLIVCDLMMPPPDGWSVLRTLATNPETAAIPFIFLTARTEGQDKIKGIELGADDFITKPFNKDELLARIHAILRRKEITETHERTKTEEELHHLSSRVSELIQNFATDHTGLAEAMAQMLSLRDNETEEHARRVVDLSTRVAQELGIEGEALDYIRLGALLHDIGKVGIPDSILLKPGALTDVERKVMMTHAALGKKILHPLGLPHAAIELVYHHHEYWDGSGYPEGLKGSAIPLSARIFAVVDVWDAITNDRPYRNAWPEKKAIQYVSDQAGIQFDPQVVQKFLLIIRRTNEGR